MTNRFIGSGIDSWKRSHINSDLILIAATEVVHRRDLIYGSG
jgi:hypothetical protein